MKVLVIPDVHLKPWMFQRASELMKEAKADRAVCLMDIADDWRQQFNLDLYEQTYDAAITFAGEYPEHNNGETGSHTPCREENFQPIIRKA